MAETPTCYAVRGPIYRGAIPIVGAQFIAPPYKD